MRWAPRSERCRRIASCVVGTKERGNPCSAEPLRNRMRIERVPGGHRPALPPAALAKLLLEAFAARVSVGD